MDAQVGLGVLAGVLRGGREPGARDHDSPAGHQPKGIQVGKSLHAGLAHAHVVGVQNGNAVGV